VDVGVLRIPFSRVFVYLFDYQVTSQGRIADLLSSKSVPTLQVLLSELILISLATPVQWCPLGLVLE
jgi:hypothetical protein